MRYLFLLNPAAGKQDCTVQLIPQIRAAAARAGWSEADYTIHTTEYAGHARELAHAAAQEAAQAGDSLRIWTAGGDGTFMEAMTGVQGFSNAAVGCLPYGSGNDFLRDAERTFLGGKRIGRKYIRREQDICLLFLPRGHMPRRDGQRVLQHADRILGQRQRLSPPGDIDRHRHIRPQFLCGRNGHASQRPPVDIAGIADRVWRKDPGHGDARTDRLVQAAALEYLHLPGLHIDCRAGKGDGQLLNALIASQHPHKRLHLAPTDDPAIFE